MLVAGDVSHRNRIAKKLSAGGTTCNPWAQLILRSFCILYSRLKVVKTFCTTRFAKSFINISPASHNPGNTHVTCWQQEVSRITFIFSSAFIQWSHHQNWYKQLKRIALVG